MGFESHARRRDAPTSTVTMRRRRESCGIKGSKKFGHLEYHASESVPYMLRVLASHHGQSCSNDSNERLVVALVVGRREELQLQEALRGTATLTTVSSNGDLTAALTTLGCCRTSRALIVEARDRNGQPSIPLIRRVRSEFPSVPVLGYCGPDESGLLIELVQADVQAVVLRGLDDARIVLRRKFQEADETCAAGMVLSRILPYVPSSLHTLVEYVVRFPRAEHSVEALAAVLGVTRKTLLNHCLRAGAPPPSAIVSMCRLLLAAHLLQSPGRTVEGIADDLEFASPSAFRNLCQRYFGLRPTELRNTAGLARAHRCASMAFAAVEAGEAAERLQGVI